MKADQTKILVLHDSGSNVILLPERYVKMYTIPNSVHWEKGTLHGVGSLEILGTACLVLPLVTTDNDTHVFTYPNAIILKLVTTIRIPQGLPTVKFSALPEAIHKKLFQTLLRSTPSQSPHVRAS